MSRAQDAGKGVNGLEIAVVGMAGRFPGAASVDEFWKNIRDGVESVTTFSDEELLARGIPAELLADPDYVKSSVHLEGVDRFDADFFGYTPRDAEHLDPQHRVLLECAWEAIEHAGYDLQADIGPVGVYASCGANLYLVKHLLPFYDLQHGGNIADLTSLLSSNSSDTLCARLAYKLNLKGPAVSVQTACSSSLTAVHLACQSLLGHECDMALAGGVSLNLLQDGGYRYQAGAIFSSDGHCRAFDAEASGTVLGSGAGLVVLKRLEDAVRDGDTIHAVIKGSAANNDGSDKVGFTAPSVNGQAEVIQAAQLVAGVPADTIAYIEAHGTGTTIGDPIEVAALTQAFRASTGRQGYCAIGSVKTNIGHLDSAAGVTGLIKTILSLKNRVLPATLNFRQPNPKIDFGNSPFYVNTVSQAWTESEFPRRAGVNSFGIGGTNIHMILEEASSREAVEAVAGTVLLPVSARSEDALLEAVKRLAFHLSEHPEQSLADVAFTLQEGRKHFGHRAVVLADSHESAIREMMAIDSPRKFVGSVISAEPTVAFLFPGQGAQYENMGRSLYEHEPLFRETVDQCAELLRPMLQEDLREIVYPEPERAAEAAERLAETVITQPALFVIEFAMARLWMSWGVHPDAMLGHSIGEYVAATLSGVFSLEDALRIVAVRGRLLQATARGAMLAVSLTEDRVQEYLGPECDLAAVNAADLCVLSGTKSRIEAVAADLTRRGIAQRRLHVSHAFHSALVEPMLAEFEAILRQIDLKAPKIPFVSNLSGTWITAEEAGSPEYWVRQVRGAVRFADGLSTIAHKADRILLEVGPGETLSGLARRHPDAGAERLILSSQCHPNRRDLNADQPYCCAARLWIAGIGCRVHGKSRRRVPLPTYPFQRQSYWIDPPAAGAIAHAGAARSRVSATDMGSWFHAPRWTRAESAERVHPTDNPGAGSIAVFGHEGGLTSEVIRCMQASGRRVVQLIPDTAFSRIDATRFTVRPDSADDLCRLLQEVETDIGPVSDICHMWSVEGKAQEERPLSDVLRLGFYSLLALAQAIDSSGSLNASRKVSITVVTDRQEDVTGQEAIRPENATLHGPCKVIPQEYPRIACRVIDIDAGGGDNSHLARTARQIASEIQHPSLDAVLAFRGPYRWTRSFEHVSRQMSGNVRLRRHGVYLITGGMGGIGFAFAKHLAQKWQAKLVLLGRTALPSRLKWDALAADGATDSLGAQISGLLELESLGAEVLPLQVDVSNDEQVHSAIAYVRQRFGALNGVIHAAGVPGGGVIATKTQAEVEKVFAPKVQGTLALMRALKDEPLDFLLFCSSLTAITGAFGQVDYCAANCFLDAAAAQAARKSDGLVISVNWDAWREVGMAAKQKMTDGSGIFPVHAGELLERLLAGPAASQTIVSTVDLQEQISRLEVGELAGRIIAEPAARRNRHPRPQLKNAYVAAAGELERSLAMVWTEFLGIEPIGIDDNLFELGGDSLLAIQVLAKVRSAYGVDIHPSEFFKTPTVAALSLMVESRLIDAIEDSEPAESVS